MEKKTLKKYQMFEEKRNKMTKEEMTKKEPDKKTKNGVVVTKKTQKKDSRKSSWRTPYLKFGPIRLKLKFAERKVSQEVSKPERIKPKEETPAQPEEDRPNKEKGFKIPEEPEPKKAENNHPKDDLPAKKTSKNHGCLGSGEATYQLNK